MKNKKYSKNTYPPTPQPQPSPKTQSRKESTSSHGTKQKSKRSHRYFAQNIFLVIGRFCELKIKST